MPTFTEIAWLMDDLDPENVVNNVPQPLDPSASLISKMRGAIASISDDVLTESAATLNHAERVQWVVRALNISNQEARRALGVVLGANATATVAQVKAATDTTIKNNLTAVLTELAVGANSG